MAMLPILGGLLSKTWKTSEWGKIQNSGFKDEFLALWAFP